MLGLACVKKLPRVEDVVDNIEPEELAILPGAATADVRSRSAIFNASSCRWISDCPGAPLALRCSGSERAEIMGDVRTRQVDLETWLLTFRCCFPFLRQLWTICRVDAPQYTQRSALNEGNHQPSPSPLHCSP